MFKLLWIPRNILLNNQIGFYADLSVALFTLLKLISIANQINLWIYMQIGVKYRSVCVNCSHKINIEYYLITGYYDFQANSGGLREWCNIKILKPDYLFLRTNLRNISYFRSQRLQIAQRQKRYFENLISWQGERLWFCCFSSEVNNSVDIFERRIANFSPKL